MPKKDTKGTPVQVNVEQYTLHVLNELVGIYGKSKAEVAGFILRSWIVDHSQVLAEHNIKIKRKDGKLVT